MNKVIKIKCPNCNTEFDYYQSASRPFCSERCKMIDLGHWFEETYRVPLKENPIEEMLENDQEYENEQEKDYNGEEY